MELSILDPVHAGGIGRCGRERGGCQAVRVDAAQRRVGRGAVPSRGRTGWACACRAGRCGDGRRVCRLGRDRTSHLHRLGRGRSTCGRARCAAAMPRDARAWRQGSDARPGWRRSRPGDRGRAVGLVLELRPDLLRGRADLRRGRSLRTVCGRPRTAHVRAAPGRRRGSADRRWAVDLGAAACKSRGARLRCSCVRR